MLKMYLKGIVDHGNDFTLRWFYPIFISDINMFSLSILRSDHSVQLPPSFSLHTPLICECSKKPNKTRAIKNINCPVLWAFVCFSKREMTAFSTARMPKTNAELMCIWIENAVALTLVFSGVTMCPWPQPELVWQIRLRSVLSGSQVHLHLYFHVDKCCSTAVWPPKMHFI